VPRTMEDVTMTVDIHRPVPSVLVITDSAFSQTRSLVKVRLYVKRDSLVDEKTTVTSVWCSRQQ